MPSRVWFLVSAIALNVLAIAISKTAPDLLGGLGPWCLWSAAVAALFLGCQEEATNAD